MAAPGSTSPTHCPGCGSPFGPEGWCPRCILGLALQPAAGPESSSAFADYLLVEQIGEGAMGTVHRARKLSLKKDVAIKFIKAGASASDRQRALFLREAELASHLDHPHIITVSEVGEHDRVPYLVMRFVDGAPLAQRLVDSRFLPMIRQRVQLLETITRAVHFAHQRGIIHRDLKPGNILIDGDGTPFVGDFGLARWLTHDTTITYGEGVAIGTPAFMSPEQASGRRQDLTIGTDVWSLGVVLYLLVAGRVPFEASNAHAVIRQILDVDPPSPFAPPPAAEPSALAARVPGPSDGYRLSRVERRDLESICLRCLEKEPRRRYTTAEALAEDLRRWQDGRPVEARPVGTRERAARWARRHPAAAGLAVASLVAATALAGTFWQRGVNANTQRLSRLYNYDADMNVAVRGLVETNLVMFSHALYGTNQDRGVRGIEWGLLQSLGRALATEPPWFTASEPLVALAVARQGGLVAVASTNHLHLLDDSGRMVRTFDLPPSNRTVCLEFSPDASTLAVGCSFGLELVGTNGSRGPVLTHTNVLAAAFAPNGHHLAAVQTLPDDLSEVLLLDLRDPVRRRTADADVASLRWHANGDLRFCKYRSTDFFQWNPDEPGPRVAAQFFPVTRSSRFSHDANVVFNSTIFGVGQLAAFDTGRPLQTLTGLPGENVQLAFSPDDRRVAYATIDGMVAVADVKSGSAATATIRRLVPGHRSAVSALEFAPDGASILTVSEDRTARRTSLLDTPRAPHFEVTSRVKRLAGIAPTFSPDSRLVALLDERPFGPPLRGSDRSLLWDTETRTTVGVLPAEVVALGPDRKALTWDRDGLLQMWDVSQPARPQLLAGFLLNRDHDTDIDSQIVDGGRRIVSLSRNGVVEAFEVGSGQTRRLAPDRLAPYSTETTPKVEYLAASPGTDMVGLGLSQGTTVLWDIRRDQLRQIQNVRPADIRFSPDGSLIAVTDYGHHVSFFDTATGNPKFPLLGHQAAANAVVFTPDGQELVTGGEDNTLVIWNLRTGREVFRRPLGAAIAWIQVSPDLRWLVVGLLPNQVDFDRRLIGPGRYYLWPIEWPDNEAPVRPAPKPPGPDTIWARFREVAAANPP